MSAKKTATNLKRIEIKLVRSIIGCKPNQRATVNALGLGKLGSKKTISVSSQVSGMLRVVNHLVKIKELN